jgi:hypothetical protein
MDAVERLDRIRFGSHLLQTALDTLWDELPEPITRRALAVRGFANVVRQHVLSQRILIQAELDVSATALVRPTYESLVRSIWVYRGADDRWISDFFTPTPQAVESDGETRMGADVAKMLADIAKQHPHHIVQPLNALKEASWRAMHSYVHGGIRPVVQSFIPFSHQASGSLLINSNGMLLLATNVVRMAHGIGSPDLSNIQRQYAECLPPHIEEEWGQVP